MSIQNMQEKRQGFLDIFGDGHEVLSQDAIDNQRIWVFGYGSILWKTGFEYNTKRVGYITGYSRKFWQGNKTHRGSPEKPGRVATLIPEENKNKQSKVWGVAYELVGESMVREAMKHLYSRECKLGGYIMHQASFFTKDCSCGPIKTLVFRATETSEHYLGSAPEFQLASQIVDCKGPSGHNIEYVVLLGMYLNQHIPDAQDTHVSTLQRHISEILINRGENMEDFVRTKYLPEKQTFKNCDDCSSINNHMYINNMKSESSFEENIGKSI